jgi:3-ketosteroid 9alpha-monooxygenase subunit A
VGSWRAEDKAAKLAATLSKTFGDGFLDDVEVWNQRKPQAPR